jgi:hypothetical protein
MDKMNRILIWSRVSATADTVDDDTAAEDTAAEDTAAVQRQWILVTTLDLSESAKPLVQRRKAQRWTVRIVTVESNAQTWKQEIRRFSAESGTNRRIFVRSS